MKRFAVTAVVGVSVSVGMVAGGCSSTSNGPSQLAADASMPANAVQYTVPTGGGVSAIHTTSGLTLNFAFPASASGMSVTLTPADPASIGWTATDFVDVIKMEPDGTQFPDPIVVTGPSVMMATFPTSSQQTAPSWLPLAPDGSGALLHHFSTLAILAPSCGALNYAPNDTSCAQTFSGNGVAYAMTCALPRLCSTVTVSCCDGQGLLATCAFGSPHIALTVTPLASPGEAYCPLVDSGAPVQTAGDGAVESGTGADASSSASDDAGMDAMGTDAATAPSDASSGTNDAQAQIADASAQPSPDSGVNGNCSNVSFVASDAGAGYCRVSRIDGQATIFMDCTPTSCQCYANDTSHPYGASFSAGQSICPQPQVAMAMMQQTCGCPVQ